MREVKTKQQPQRATAKHAPLCCDTPEGRRVRLAPVFDYGAAFRRAFNSVPVDRHWAARTDMGR